MKIILFTIALLVSINSFGQKKIENKLTEEHQNIRGTKVSLIPPAEFSSTMEDMFFTFSHAKSESKIMVLKLPFPYSDTSFSKTTLKKDLLVSEFSEEFKVSKIEKSVINEFSAMLIIGTLNNLHAAYMLLFGTDKETIMIFGSYPKKEKEIGKEIKKSIFSVYYDANNELVDFPDFSIDVSGTKLRLFMDFFGVILFTVDGKAPPTSSNDKTELGIIKQSFDTIQEDKKTFAINCIKKTSPLDDEKIEYMNEISINGISGYEIYEKGGRIKDSEIINNYYVILFENNFYYLINGATNDQTEASLEQFKKIARTFKRK